MFIRALHIRLTYCVLPESVLKIVHQDMHPGNRVLGPLTCCMRYGTLGTDIDVKTMIRHEECDVTDRNTVMWSGEDVA